MIFFLWLFSLSFAFAQELELTTNNVHVYARVKNCIDFYLCSPYEEQLKIENGYYHWKAQFKTSLPVLQSAFKECSVGDLKFDITIRDEKGIARKDFSFPRSKITPEVQRYLLPMELYSRSYEGLKAKDKTIGVLLQSNEPLTAMKSVSFEMEYPLGEYHLVAESIAKSNTLATTDHLKKLITYDLDKWDGTVCRFYEVMRHETQHVRNFRKRQACKFRHHFDRGNHDERSTYLNDLVFLKTYCPDNKSLYKNVETVLLMMYQNKDLQPCGVGDGTGQGGNGTGSGQGEDKGKGTTTPSVKGTGKSLDDLLKDASKFKFYRQHSHKPIKRPTRTANPNALH